MADDKDENHRRTNWLERALEPPENSLVRKMLSEWVLYKGALLLLWRIVYWASGIIFAVYMSRDVLGKIFKALLT